MAYEKRTWVTGDIITATKLNHIETGIDNAHDLIENIQNEGLSDDVKQALLNCFAHVAWIDEYGQDYYDALYNALYVTHTITNNLTDVVNSNDAVSIADGSAYTATLTAESGYISDLVITMNGVDITNEVFTPNS